jgi:hypothetical protein
VISVAYLLAEKANYQSKFNVATKFKHTEMKKKKRIFMNISKRIRNKIYKKAYNHFCSYPTDHNYICPTIKKCFRRYFCKPKDKKKWQDYWLSDIELNTVLPELNLFYPYENFNSEYRSAWPIEKKERKIILCFLWAMTLPKKTLYKTKKNKKLKKRK